jgi:hypothetical protein
MGFDSHFLNYRLSIKNVMATIIAIRKNRNLSDQTEVEQDNLMDNLIVKVPPQETWDTEFFLDMLVAG